MPDATFDLFMATGVILLCIALAYRRPALDLLVTAVATVAALGAGSAAVDLARSIGIEWGQIWLQMIGFGLVFGPSCALSRANRRTGLVLGVLWMALEWSSVFSYGAPAPPALILASAAPLLFGIGAALSLLVTSIEFGKR